MLRNKIYKSIALILLTFFAAGFNPAFCDEDGVKTKIKIFNENTGQLVNTLYPTGLIGGENSVEWDAAALDLPKGAYKIQLNSEDDLGNQSLAYASCVD